MFNIWTHFTLVPPSGQKLYKRIWMITDESLYRREKRQRTFPVDHQGFDQRVELPELLVCRFHLLQLLLEPLQHNAPLVQLQH